MLELSDIAKLTFIIALSPFFIWLLLGIISISKSKKQLFLCYLATLFLMGGMFFFFDNQYIRYDQPIGESTRRERRSTDDLDFYRCTGVGITPPPEALDTSGSPFIYEEMYYGCLSNSNIPHTYRWGIVLNLISYAAISGVVFESSRRVVRKLKNNK